MVAYDIALTSITITYAYPLCPELRSILLVPLRYCVA